GENLQQQSGRAADLRDQRFRGSGTLQNLQRKPRSGVQGAGRGLSGRKNRSNSDPNGGELRRYWPLLRRFPERRPAGRGGSRQNHVLPDLSAGPDFNSGNPDRTAGERRDDFRGRERPRLGTEPLRNSEREID